MFHLLNHRNFKKDERVCLNLEGKEPLSPTHTHLLIGCEWRDVWRAEGVPAVTGTVAWTVPCPDDHTAGPGEGQWAGVVWGSPAHHLWGSLHGPSPRGESRCPGMCRCCVRRGRGCTGQNVGRVLRSQNYALLHDFSPGSADASHQGLLLNVSALAARDHHSGVKALCVMSQAADTAVFQ